MRAHQLEGLDEVEATVGGDDVLCQNDGLGVLVGTGLADQALHVLLNATLGLLEYLRRMVQIVTYKDTITVA